MCKSIIKSNFIWLVATSFLFSPNVVGTVFAQAPGDDFPDVVSPAAPGTDLLLLQPLPENILLIDPPNPLEDPSKLNLAVPGFPVKQEESGDIPTLLQSGTVYTPPETPPLPPKPQSSRVYSTDLEIVPPPTEGGIALLVDPITNFANHEEFLTSLGLPPMASHYSIIEQACSLLGASLENCASNSTSYTYAEKTELLGALMMVIADIGARDPSTWDEHERALISWVEDRIQAQQVDYAERQIKAWEKFKADYAKSVLEGPKFSQLLDTGPDPANFDSPELYDWSLVQENSVKNLTQGFANSPALVGLVSGVGVGVGIGVGIGVAVGAATATMAVGAGTAAAGAFLTSVGAGVGATAGAMVGAAAAPAAIVVVAVAVIAVVGTKIKNANEMEAAIYDSLEVAKNTRPNFHELVTADGAKDGIALALMDAFFGKSSTAGSTISSGGITLQVAK